MSSTSVKELKSCNNNCSRHKPGKGIRNGLCVLCSKRKSSSPKLQFTFIRLPFESCHWNQFVMVEHLKLGLFKFLQRFPNFQVQLGKFPKGCFWFSKRVGNEWFLRSRDFPRNLLQNSFLRLQHQDQGFIITPNSGVNHFKMDFRAVGILYRQWHFNAKPLF